MELICPHCGRDRLWYDPYTGNFDCPTCGTSALPEELTCPLCGKAGSLRAEDGILCCGSCGEVLCDLCLEETALDYYYEEILGGYDEESAGDVWDGMDD